MLGYFHKGEFVKCCFDQRYLDGWLEINAGALGHDPKDVEIFELPEMFRNDETVIFDVDPNTQEKRMAIGWTESVVEEGVPKQILKFRPHKKLKKIDFEKIKEEKRLAQQGQKQGG